MEGDSKITDIFNLHFPYTLQCWNNCINRVKCSDLDSESNASSEKLVLKL